MDKAPLRLLDSCSQVLEALGYTANQETAAYELRQPGAFHSVPFSALAGRTVNAFVEWLDGSGYLPLQPVEDLAIAGLDGETLPEQVLLYFSDLDFTPYARVYAPGYDVALDTANFPQVTPDSLLPDPKIRIRLECYLPGFSDPVDVQDLGTLSLYGGLVHVSFDSPFLFSIDGQLGNPPRGYVEVSAKLDLPGGRGQCSFEGSVAVTKL